MVAYLTTGLVAVVAVQTHDGWVAYVHALEQKKMIAKSN